MSLLDPIEEHFAPVSNNWFIDNKWSYKFDVDIDKGTWYHIEQMIVRQSTFDKTKQYKSIIYWTVKCVYNTDTKKFTINCNNEALLKSNYNVIFNKFEINNPTVVEIELALNHEFIRSLFIDA